MAWAEVSKGKCRPATNVSAQITSCCEEGGVTMAESSPIPKLTSDFDVRLKYRSIIENSAMQHQAYYFACCFSASRSFDERRSNTPLMYLWLSAPPKCFASSIASSSTTRYGTSR